MKKLLVATVAMTLVGPLAAMSASAQDNRYGPDARQTQQGPDARSGDRQAQAPAVNYGRDRSKAWRDDRQDARWDDSQHNGYYQNKRWHAGPPPAYRSDVGYDRGRVTLGYQPWSRGQHLGYYNRRYREVDYRSQNLRRPPRGYHWVRDDSGDYLLAAVVSGLIAQVIVNSR